MESRDETERDGEREQERGGEREREIERVRYERTTKAWQNARERYRYKKKEKNQIIIDKEG